MSGKDNQQSAPDTPGVTRAVRKLDEELAEARQLDRLMRDPLLDRIRAMRLRIGVTRSLWFFLACGLGFTTAGVQGFLARGMTVADPQWWAAWLVEPSFAGILITVLRWEAEMIARGLEVRAKAVSRLKGLLLFATLVMNVIPTLWVPPGHQINAGDIFVHIVIPIVVYLIAEVIPVVQRLGQSSQDTAAGEREIPHPLPVDSSASAASTPQSRVRLPADVLARVRNALSAAQSQGRAPTVADVTSVVALPEPTAARLLTELTAPMNGHSASP